MKFVALFVKVMLWLGIALSPVLASLVFAVFLILQANLQTLLTLTICGTLGLIVGIYWAEKIRRTSGLSQFWGRLIGHPELENSSAN